MTETTTLPQSTSRRRSREEASALVSDWRASGLKQAAFCQQRDIPRSALVSCLGRVSRSESSPPAPTGFIEVRRQSPPCAAVMTLEIDGGLRMTGLDVSTAAALITALRSVPQ
jgi:hypothetical protein